MTIARSRTAEPSDVRSRGRKDTTDRRDEGSRRSGFESGRSWPIGRTGGWYLVALYVGLTAASLAVGLILKYGVEDTALGRADLSAARWFADQRTPGVEDGAMVVSNLSDSLYVVPTCAILLAVFLRAWRRWHEIVFVMGTLILEKCVFLSSTFIVDRDRPPVGQLDGQPPSSSFFSGHVAAAVVFYFALLGMLAWHTRNRIVLTLGTLIAFTAVTLVSLSRLELGMHHVSDVIWGIIVGVALIVGMREALRIERQLPDEHPVVDLR